MPTVKGVSIYTDNRQIPARFARIAVSPSVGNGQCPLVASKKRSRQRFVQHRVADTRHLEFA
jgi:hypothetical protein